MIDKDTIFFSQLPFKDTFKTFFVCYNKSDERIKIIDIENGCGCTSTFFKDSIIEPHDSVVINISYIPKKSNDSGKVAKLFMVRSDADIPFSNVFLKGEVIK